MNRKTFLLMTLAVIGSVVMMAPSAKADPYLPYHGWCEDGNQQVTTSGLTSSTTVQGSYPQCTVTVFVHGGTTMATIYSDSTGTVLANPFTSDTNGQIIWYAAPGRYDMQMSAGLTPNTFPVPVTIEDITLGDAGAPTGGGVQVNGIATLNSLIPFYGNLSNSIPAAPAGNTNCTWQVDVANPTDISCYVPSSSGGIQVNGAATLNSSAPYFGNFSNTTPAAPSGGVNVLWQVGSSSPNSISAYIPSSALVSTPYIQVPTSTFIVGAGDQSTVDSQLLGTLNLASLTQGTTAQGPFAQQLQSNGLLGPLMSGGGYVPLVSYGSCHGAAAPNSGVTCTVNLTTPTPPGATALAFAYASTQAVDSGPSVTDASGDSCTGSGFTANVVVCQTVTAGTSSFNCTTPNGGIQAGTAACEIFIVTNYGGVDVSSRTEGTGDSDPTGFTGSVTTVTANDTLLGVIGEGSDWPCYGQQLLASGGAYVYGVTALDNTAAPVKLNAYLAGAATTGTYSMTATVAEISGGGGCPGSANPAPIINLVALRPASSITANYWYPTWRGVGALDFQQWFGNLGSPIAQALELPYSGLQVNGATQKPEYFTNWTSGVSCSDSPSTLSLNCSASGTPQTYPGVGVPYVSATNTWGTSYNTNCNTAGSSALIFTVGTGIGCNTISTFSNPMTTLGDIIYGGASGAPTRLAGNTTTSTYCLLSTGTGTAANAPAWNACPTGSGTAIQVNGTATQSTANFANSSTVTFSGATSGSVTTITATASGGGGTTATAAAKQVLAGPIVVPGTPIRVEPLQGDDPCIFTSASIYGQCTYTNIPANTLLAAWWHTAYETFSGCSVTDSSGLTWTQKVVATSAESLLYTTTTGAAVPSDTITFNCTSGTIPQNWQASVQIYALPGALALDGSYTSVDSPATGMNTVPLTTAYPNELVLGLVANANPQYIPAAFDFPGAVDRLAYKYGSPSLATGVFSQPSLGTQNYQVNLPITGSWTRYAFFSFEPKAPEGSKYTVCTNSTGNVTSCAASFAVAVGDRVVVDMPLGAGSLSCAITDSLSDTYVVRNPTSTNGEVADTDVSTAGTPTLTLTGCATGAGSQVILVEDIGPGYQFANAEEGHIDGTPSTIATTADSDYVLVSAMNPASGTTYTFSNSLAVLTGSSAAVPSYGFAEAVVPSAQNYPWETYQAPAAYGGLAVVYTLATPPQYAAISRPIQNTDVTPPQLVTYQIPAGTSSLQFNGGQYGNWVAEPLTAPLTGTSFIGMQDGQAYHWTFCQPTSGGPYAVSFPSNVNYTPSITTTPGECSTFGGTWSSAMQQMVFRPSVAYVPLLSALPSLPVAGSNTGSTTVATSTGLNAVASPTTFMAVYVGWFNVSATVTGVADTAGNVCTPISQTYSSANLVGGALFGCPVTVSNASDIVTATFNASVQYPMLAVFYATNTSGVAGSPLATGYTTGTSQTGPSLLVPSGSYALSIVRAGSSPTWTWGAGWSAYGTPPPSVGDLIVPATALVTPTATASASGDNYSWATFYFAPSSATQYVAGSTTALAANSCGDTVTATAPGAATTMAVTATPQTALGAGLILDSGTTRISAANTLTVGYCNVTTGSLTPAASNLNVRITP